MCDYGLNDKVVVVTGAGSGNGEGIAIQFAKHGSRVVINDKDESNVKRVASVCDQNSPFDNKSLVHVGDLTEENVCEQLIQKATEHFGTIDVLVNNAGIVTFCSVSHEEYMQNYDNVMNVNTRVPMKLSRLSLPYLLKSKGCIVNISSVAAYCPFDSAVHYSMSKAALDAMTRNLAHEYGPKSVRVVSINLGVIKTNIHKTLGIAEAMYEEYAKTYPLRRPGQPSEVANVVCFAASKAASFITGTSVMVDGGYRVK